MSKQSVVHVENEVHAHSMYTLNDIYVKNTSLKKINVDNPTFYHYKSGVVRGNDNVNQIILPNQKYIPIIKNTTPSSIILHNNSSTKHELYISSHNMYYENTSQLPGYVVWKF